MPRGFIAVLLLAAACSSTDAAKAERRYAFLPECDIKGIEGKVLCGHFEVPENREQPGRTIPLAITVLLATGPDRKPDPVLPLQGGPGQSATGLARFYARFLKDLRRDRDIVLIDVRGTGGSGALGCDALTPEWLQSGELMPPALVRQCRERLEQHADLRQYTTAVIARDIDDVRMAMGVEQWNLYGSSYGTRLAQEYVRAFGTHVRTMTLYGVAAPSLAIPLPYARDAQAAADKLFDERTRAALTSVIARLRKEPARVPDAGGEVVITAGVFAEALRNMIYSAGAAGRASDLIRAADNGDFTAAAEAVRDQRLAFSGEIAFGLFLSVTCAEDIPRIETSQIDEATRGTFLGDYRVRQQMAACREWTAGRGRPEAAQPLVSNVPALLVSGDVDPVTPPRMGEEVVRTLSNGRHVIFGGAGHGYGSEAPCATRLMTAFIEAGSARQLDTSCVVPSPAR